MTYDFDTIVPRRGTGSVKWDEARDRVLPMWVADMDFAVAPCIQHAILERAKHPIFGYVSVPESYYDALTKWYAERHNWTIDRQSIIYTTGVVPAVSAILQSVIQPGEKVIVQGPAYNCFFSCIRNSGAELSVNPLLRFEIDENSFSYRLDLEDLERRCADDTAKVLIMCNPHNPSGRCWSREELLAVADICERHDVLVIADEIHNELTTPGTQYTPWGTLGSRYQRNAAICVSASKSFNIAGLQMANIIISDQKLRRRVDKRININETCDVGPFGYVAATAAFSIEGAEWLDALRKYLWDNYQTFADFMHTHVPQCKLTRLEATYLVWVDVSTIMSESERLAELLERDADLWVNPGSHYGEKHEPVSGDNTRPATSRIQLPSYLRFNIACPRQQMLEGLRRFADFINKIQQQQEHLTSQ